VKPIFSHNGRFNAHTDVFNDEIYVKLDDDRDTIDSAIFFFSKINLLHDGYNYDTMIVTYQKDDGLDHDTDDDENQTSRFHRSRLLNYQSSVIQNQSYANGHFKKGQVLDSNFYTYDITDFDMIKAVAISVKLVSPRRKNFLSTWPSTTRRPPTSPRFSTIQPNSVA